MSFRHSAVIAGTMKWGAWGARFSTQDYLAMIRRCVEIGVTTFDHADIYGHYTTEEGFGEALRLDASLRPRIQLISKCGIRMVTPNRPAHQIKSYDTGREHIIQSAEQSLKNLQTDYIDLLLIHRPDILMHADEIAEAFTTLHQQGKVLQFGVSNFTPSQTALLRSRYPILTNQFEVSILHRDPFLDGTLDQCQEWGLIPMSWSPLGGGRLYGGDGNEQVRRIEAVCGILGEKYGAGMDQILLAWLLRHPAGIVPVLGTTRFERVQDALKATHLTLQREEWYMLWRAATGKEVP